MDDTDKIAEAIRTLLREGMDRSPRVRGLVTALAEWVLAEPAAEDSAAEVTGPLEIEDQPEEAEETQEPSTTQGVVELSLGESVLDIKVPGTAADLASAKETARPAPEPRRPTARPAIDLGLIAAKCGLKAEACRLCVERTEAGADTQREWEFRSRASDLLERRKKLDDAFLWMLLRDKTQPDTESMRRIASCYETHRAACEVAAASVASKSAYTRPELERALELLAEANSALRVVLQESTWLTQPDKDQDDTHLWLLDKTRTLEHYITQHMTLDDPGDPARAGEILGEVRSLAEGVEERLKNEHKVTSTLNTMRYHLKNQSADGQLEPHDARRINESAEALIDMGIEPGDNRLVELKNLINLDAFPDTVSPGDAMREIASGPPTPEPDEPTERGSAWNDGVLRVREFLRGGRVVMVGGKPGEYAEQGRRIEEAFELSALDWAELTEHGTAARMEHLFTRDDVRLVLTITKLGGHQHIDFARDAAKKIGVPCVMLKGGHNPNRVAFDILDQASDQLGG